MSLHGEALGHLVRRGVEVVRTATPEQQYVQALLKQSNLYEEAGPENEVKPWQFLAIVATAVVFLILYASVKYTLGEVVASLAMIEQPQTLIVSERKVVNDSDPDAPLEKEPLMIDEEVVMIKEQPMTSSLRKTIRHLHQVGGFRARWRGLGVSIVYHMLHGISANLFAAAFGTPYLRPVAYLLSSVLLCRIHATWTQIMISSPSALPWYRRVVRGKKVIKTLALPSFVFALAQQLVIIMPILVWFAWGQVTFGQTEGDFEQQKFLGLRILTTLSTAAATAILILLPASVTLTRIEASLLPEDQETIVSFDRTLNGAVTSEISLDTVNSKSIFIKAWRSFDKPSRLRLVKFYAKMVLVQVHLIFTGFVTVSAEIMLLGPERLNLLVQSGSAQLQLAAMGVNGGN